MNTATQTVLASNVATKPACFPSVPDRFRKLEKDSFDVIVIGAGTGGLTAAALLAKRGRSVLVLDRHYVAGGNATVFHRPGYQFDVGLHYLGDCGPDGYIPRILRAAGVGDIVFRELDPDGFDTLVFPDFIFRVPKGIENFRARLVERFPNEARGIDRYLEILRGLQSLQELSNSGFAHAMQTLWGARKTLWHINDTLKNFFDTCTTDPRLQAVLAGQSGDYAEPPSRASLLVNAMVTSGYLKGAYYPVGGAQVTSDRLADSIERHGGKILLMTEVTRIVVEGWKAVGVEFNSHHLGRCTVRAPVVISDADLKHTLLDLVGPAYLSDKTVKRTRVYEMSPALGVVFLGIRRDLRVEGVPNTNFWVHPSYDQEPVYADARAGRFHPQPFCFISSSTLKDPDNPKDAPPGITKMELVAVVPSQPKAWGTTEQEIADGSYHDNPAYKRIKAAFAGRLIRTAERVFPGLGGQVVYQEVASPMTHTRFTGSTGGTSYGIALIPSQFLFKRPGNSTEVKGLYLCGANTMSGHGILGTMWSGLLAASRIVGGDVLREVTSKRE